MAAKWIFLMLFYICSENNFGGNEDNRKFVNDRLQSNDYEYPATTQASNKEPESGRSASSGRNSPTSSNKQNLV